MTSLLPPPSRSAARRGRASYAFGMGQELERAALVALLRRGDRSWPDLTDQIDTVGSAREVLDNALDTSGQAALFDTGPAVGLEAVAAEVTSLLAPGDRRR